MGALHEGHLSLIDKALGECSVVACSVFVNPLQFNNPEDLAAYPRQIEHDAALLDKAGCHMLFNPTEASLYAGAHALHYDLGGLDAVLEGASRPGHFQGVVNVVERLFHYVRPDRAYFGEKDRQQLTIVEHVRRQQRWPVEIVACPTARATSGLALSSRNQRLSTTESAHAAVLHRALQAVAGKAFRAAVPAARQAGLDVLATEASVRTDYLEITDKDDLKPLKEWGDRTEALALIAAEVGPVRLIDNITLRR